MTARDIAIAVLKWAGGSSAVVLVTGFISEFAYQQRLGYALPNRGDVIGHTIEGGTFFLDTLLVSVGWVAESVSWVIRHRSYLLVGGGALVVGLLVRWFARKKIAKGKQKIAACKYAKQLLVVGLLPVIAAMIGNILIFDVPLLHHKGLLVHGFKHDASARLHPTFVKLASTVWQDEVCSRIATNQRADVPSPGCPRSPDLHARRGQRRFVLNLLATSLLAGLVVWVALVKSKSFDRARAWLMLPALVAFVDLSLLPYNYGKTMRSTRASEVILRVKHESVVTPEHGFLLHQDNSYVAIFHKKTKHLWVIPRNRVELMQVEGQRDVVEFLVKSKLENREEEDDAP